MDARSNLGVQIALIARSRFFLSTCGGLAWLAPFLNVPTVAVYDTDHCVCAAPAGGAPGRRPDRRRRVQPSRPSWHHASRSGRRRDRVDPVDWPHGPRSGRAAVAIAWRSAPWRWACSRYRTGSLSFEEFPNDHYMHLAIAQQITRGALGARDYIELGIPLMTMLSAWAQLALGDGLRSELILIALLFAVAASLTMLAAAWLGRSLIVGTLVATVRYWPLRSAIAIRSCSRRRSGFSPRWVTAGSRRGSACGSVGRGHCGGVSPST